MTNAEQVLRDSVISWLQDAAPQGVLITDTALTVRGWNHWLERHTGRPAQTVLGQHLFEVCPELRQRRLEQYYRHALEGRPAVLAQALHGYLLALPPTAGNHALPHMQQTAQVVPLMHECRITGTLTVIEDVTERVLHEQALVASESRYRTLAEESVLGVYLVQDGRIRYANPALARILGHSCDELYALPDLLHVIHPEDHVIILRNRERRAQGKASVVHYECRIVRKNGEIRDVEVFGRSPSQKGLSTIAGTIMDITDRKRAEEKLQRAEARLVTILETAVDGIIAVDEAQRITLFNQGAEKIFGWTAAEVLDQPLDLLLPERFQAAHRGHVLRFARGSACAQLMSRRSRVFGRRKDGSEFPAEISISKAEQDGTTILTAVVRDVTERIRVEDALRETEARLHAAFENIPFEFWICDTEGRFVMQNAQSIARRGYQVGDRFEDLGWPEPVLQRWRVNLRRALAGEIVQGLVEETEDGCRRSYHNILAPIRHGQEVRGVLGINIDITDRVEMEETLRQSEHRYRTLVESSVQGIAIHQDYVIEYANPAFAQIFGCDSPEAAVGQCIWDVVGAVNERPTLEARCEAILRGEAIPVHPGWKVEKQGRTIWVESGLCQVMWRGRPALLSFFLDVTDRKQAEEQLRASEERFRQMAETIQEAFWMFHAPSRRVLYVSPAWAAIFGWPGEELLANPERCLASIHADDREHVERALTDGVLAHGQELEYRIVRPDRSSRWVRLKSFRVHGPDSSSGLYAGTIEDITERKSLEQQFLQAQKMEAIGRLAGGVAHDFNNLLTVIGGYSDMLYNGLDRADPKRRQPLDEIRKACRRAAGLTGQLLAFSRKQVLSPVVLDLNSLVQSAEAMLRRLIREDIELETRFDPHLGQVRADPGQLEQVVMNLVVNARDAMPDGGQVTIETRAVVLDESYCETNREVVPGSYVMLAVSDTGCGMDESTRTRIFEPFFTTKGVGKGTGLGLATVYGIIKQSGGHLTLSSELGKGTTFQIYLPRTEEPAAAAGSRSVSEATARGTETILLAEDEAGVRTLACRALQNLGYTVLEAENGEAALRIAQRYPGPIDLLLTDVIMPRLNGRQLADRLLRQRPGLRVLYISGYTDDALARHGVLEPGTAFLHKPFTPLALGANVREVLDRPAPPLAPGAEVREVHNRPAPPLAPDAEVREVQDRPAPPPRSV